MSVESCYDIEGDLESAIGPILSATISALTPQDDPTFQKDRPRVEVMVQLGAGKSNHVQLIDDGTGTGQLREDAWDATLRVELLTGADIKIHSSYRAFLRDKISNMPALINGITLMNHVIYYPIRSLGTSPVLTPQAGYYKTVMNYALVVSIHQDAWALLTA